MNYFSPDTTDDKYMLHRFFVYLAIFEADFKFLACVLHWMSINYCITESPCIKYRTTRF